MFSLARAVGTSLAPFVVWPDCSEGVYCSSCRSCSFFFLDGSFGICRAGQNHAKIRYVTFEDLTYGKSPISFLFEMRSEDSQGPSKNLPSPPGPAVLLGRLKPSHGGGCGSRLLPSLFLSELVSRAAKVRKQKATRHANKHPPGQNCTDRHVLCRDTSQSYEYTQKICTHSPSVRATVVQLRLSLTVRNFRLSAAVQPKRTQRLA